MQKKDKPEKRLSFFRIFFTTFLVLLAGGVLETILYAAKEPMFIGMFLLFLLVKPSIFLPFLIPILLYVFLYALLMRNQRVSLTYVILFNSALVLYYVLLTFLGFSEITSSFMQFFLVLPYSGFIGFFIFLLAQYFLILFAKRKKETNIRYWFLAFGLAIACVILLYGIYGATSSVLWSAKTEPCQYIEDTSMTVPAMKWQSPYLGIVDYRDKVALEIVDQRCLLENDQQWLYFTAKVINVEDHAISWTGGLGIDGVDYVNSEAFSLRNLLPVLSYILTARDIPVLFDWDIEPGQSKIAFYNASPSSEIITISSIEQYTSLEKFPEPDLDRDGLNDEEEIEYGTDPANKDTDDDELSDAEEVMMYLTDPNDSDSDDDGFTDHEELYTDLDEDGLTGIAEFNYGTDPTNYDTDGDGYSDGGESISAGTYFSGDPLNPAVVPATETVCIEADAEYCGADCIGPEEAIKFGKGKNTLLVSETEIWSTTTGFVISHNEDICTKDMPGVIHEYYCSSMSEIAEEDISCRSGASCYEGQCAIHAK